MIVRELFASMGIKLDEKSVSAADKAIERLKDGLKELVAAYVGFEGVKNVAEKFMKLGESATQLEALAKKTGMNTDALQELHYAAAQTATDAAELDQGLIHLQRSAFEAATQGGEAGAAFKRLGIEVTGANGKVRPTNELLGMVADKFAVLPDGAQKTALSMAILSRSGAALIPLLSKGSAGLAQFGVDARRTGGVMSEGLIKAGEELDTVITNLKFTFRGLTYAILGPFVHAVTEGVKHVASWLAAHRQIISLRIQDAVSVIAGAFELAAKGAKALGDWLIPIGAILLALLSPITAVTAALLFLANDFNRYLNGKDSIIGRLSYAFDKWFDTMKGKNPIVALFTDGTAAAEKFGKYLTDLLNKPGMAALLGATAGFAAGGLPGAAVGGLTGAGLYHTGNTAIPEPTLQNDWLLRLTQPWTSQQLATGNSVNIGKIEINAPASTGDAILDGLKDAIQQVLDDNMAAADPGRN